MNNYTGCIYCGSESYGKGCIYSPTDTHIHINASGCIYCGSESRGGGCCYNPYGNTHVRGVEFLNKSAVQAEKAAVLTYILNMASSILIEGQTYTSPLDRLYKRVSYMIASIAEPLLETFSFQEAPTYKNLSKKDLIKTVEFKNKFKKQLSEFSQTISEASLALPKEIVENALIDAIVDMDVRKIKN